MNTHFVHGATIHLRRCSDGAGLSLTRSPLHPLPRSLFRRVPAPQRPVLVCVDPEVASSPYSVQPCVSRTMSSLTSRCAVFFSAAGVWGVRTTCSSPLPHFPFAPCPPKPLPLLQDVLIRPKRSTLRRCGSPGAGVRPGGGWESLCAGPDMKCVQSLGGAGDSHIHFQALQESVDGCGASP